MRDFSIVRAWRQGSAIGRWLSVAIVVTAMLAGVLAVATRARANSATQVKQTVGTRAPVVALPGQVSGLMLPASFLLGAPSGHPQLVVFFFTLCPHCLAEVRAIAAQEYRSAAGDAQVVYVDSPGERPDIAQAYAVREGITTPVLLDGNQRAAAAYHVSYFPTIVLIDGQGVVRHVWYGDVSPSVLQRAVVALPASARGR